MSDIVKLEDFSRHGAGSRSYTRINAQACLAIEINKLLWEAYQVLDHGNHDERLAMLDRLEAHFKKVVS